MRRAAVLLVAAVLVAAACGDDDAGTSTEPPPEPTTASLAPPPTDTTTSSTTEATTTTTTEPAGNPLVDAAVAFAGDWVGQWNNTTFGSSGSVNATVDVNADAQFGLLTLDLGGFVFGGADPDPIVMELDLAVEPPFETSDGLFGDSTVTIGADGSVTMTAHAVPGLGGLTMVVEGTPDPAGYQMTYTIQNPDGSVFAEGFMDLAPAG